MAFNYVLECFRPFPQEVGAASNAYRLILALAIPFFFQQWAKKVSIEWLFGMAVFFNIFVFLLVLLLILQGPRLRRASFLESVSEA